MPVRGMKRLLKCDRHTIMCFVAKGHGVQRELLRRRCKLTVKDLCQIQQEASSNIAASSVTMFQNFNLNVIFITARYSVLRDIAKDTMAQIQTTLNKGMQAQMSRRGIEHDSGLVLQRLCGQMR